MAPPGIKYSQEPPDIEVRESIFNFGHPASSETDFQNVLTLNSRVNTHTNFRPTAVTKADKHNWKRNSDKSCTVRSITNSCSLKKPL